MERDLLTMKHDVADADLERRALVVGVGKGSNEVERDERRDL